MSAPEAPRLQELIAEAQRVLTICNACRYCEGYCAVFPALERRLAFDESEIHYLANLCHNCGACLYACQYAPPHEFKLNFPRVLAQVRKETYKKYAWPGFLASAFERNGAVVAIVTMLSLAFFIFFTAWYADPARFFQAHPGRAGIVLRRAAPRHHGRRLRRRVRFRDPLSSSSDSCASGGTRANASASSRGLGRLGSATWDAAALKYLDGGGDGCTYPDAKPSFARRNCHHLTFYGFLLCFAATVVATIYHYGFGWKAPYAFFSLPVILGTLGGVGLLAGPVGLLWLKHRRDPELEDPTQTGMDAGFLVLLFVTSLSGLLLLAFRETRAMGVLLALHLGAVMALFLTLPYGKFVHAIYRFAALARYHVERRRPLSEIAAE